MNNRQPARLFTCPQCRKTRTLAAWRKPKHCSARCYGDALRMRMKAIYERNQEAR